MLDTGFAVALADREVDARVLEHPFRVVGLAHSGGRCKKLRIEANGGIEVPDGYVHVETFHARFLAWAGGDCGWHSAPQASPARLQQFSVRKPTRPFIRSKFGL